MEMIGSLLLVNYLSKKLRGGENMIFKEVTAQNPKWEFIKDKELVGQLIAKEENVGPNASKLYTVKKQDGSLISVWGSTVLDKRFALIEPGSLIQVKYKGMITNEKSGRSYHDFFVGVSEDDSDQESVD